MRSHSGTSMLHGCQREDGIGEEAGKWLPKERIPPSFSIFPEAEKSSAIQTNCLSLLLRPWHIWEGWFILIFLCKKRESQGRVPELSPCSPDGSSTNPLTPPLQARRKWEHQDHKSQSVVTKSKCLSKGYFPELLQKSVHSIICNTDSTTLNFKNGQYI